VASSKVLSHEGGEYRLFNLDPGFYYLSASISSRTVQSWTSVVTFTPNLPDPGEGFTTTFFPDETSVSRARLIYLNSQSAFKVDLIFRNVPNFRVSARLTLPPNGQPFLNPNVALVPAGVDLAAASNYRMGRSGSNFTMNRVADGIYTIVATAEYPNSGGGTTTVIVSSPRTVQISDNTELSLEAVGAIEIPGRFVLEGNAQAAFRRSSEMKCR
jgi:hypothetical protein